MSGIEIGAKDCVLFGGRHRDPHFADYVGVAPRNPAHAGSRTKVLGDDAHGNTGSATFAGRPVGDRLAAAEPALGQGIVEVAWALAAEGRKGLPFLLPGEIRARAPRR